MFETVPRESSQLIYRERNFERGAMGGCDLGIKKNLRAAVKRRDKAAPNE